MCCLIYIDNFFSMTIFYCHIEANMPAFHQMYLSHKNWQFSVWTQANKNCYMKVASVDKP